MADSLFWIPQGPPPYRASSADNWSLIFGVPASDGPPKEDDMCQFTPASNADIIWDISTRVDVDDFGVYTGTMTLDNDAFFGNLAAQSMVLDVGPYDIDANEGLTILNTLIASAGGAKITYTGTGSVNIEAQALNVPWGYVLRVTQPVYIYCNEQLTLPILHIDCPAGTTVKFASANSMGVGTILNTSGGWEVLNDSTLTIGGRFAQTWIGTTPTLYDLLRIDGGDGPADSTILKCYAHTGHTVNFADGHSNMPRTELFTNESGGDDPVWEFLDGLSNNSSHSTFKFQESCTINCHGDMYTGLTATSTQQNNTYNVNLNGYIWGGSSWFIPPTYVNSWMNFDLGEGGTLIASGRVFHPTGNDYNFRAYGTGTFDISNLTRDMDLGTYYMPWDIIISGSMSTSRTLFDFNVKSLTINGVDLGNPLVLSASSVHHADNMVCNDTVINGPADLSISLWSRPVWTGCTITNITLTDSIVGAKLSDGNVDGGGNTGFVFDEGLFPPVTPSTIKRYARGTSVGVGVGVGLPTTINGDGSTPPTCTPAQYAQGEYDENQYFVCQESATCTPAEYAQNEYDETQYFVCQETP